VANFRIKQTNDKGVSNNVSFIQQFRGFKPTMLFVLIILTVLATGVHTFAQKTDYRPGDRIMYKANPNKDVWEEGTFVKKTYDGSQPVVRFKPDQYFPNGWEQALASWDQIRPYQAATQNPKANNDPPVRTVPQTPRNTTPAGGGKGVMTKEEVLAYMREHTNGAKQDPQVCKDLIEIIKRRGVKERLHYGKDDVSPITKNGCSYVGTDVMAAVDSNLGAPTTLGWLTGTWKLAIWGINNKYVNTNTGRVVTHDVVGAAGSLTINANGTYTWRAEPESKVYQGTWRNATAQEMVYQGGTGLVLHNAVEGTDWIVYKKMSQDGDDLDRLEVENLKYRGSDRYVGTR
jgi:hypothetical protein